MSNTINWAYDGERFELLDPAEYAELDHNSDGGAGSGPGIYALGIETGGATTLIAGSTDSLARRLREILAKVDAETTRQSELAAELTLSPELVPAELNALPELDCVTVREETCSAPTADGAIVRIRGAAIVAAPTAAGSPLSRLVTELEELVDALPHHVRVTGRIEQTNPTTGQVATLWVDDRGDVRITTAGAHRAPRW